MYKRLFQIFIAVSLVGCANSSRVADIVVSHEVIHARQYDSVSEEHVIYSTLIREMYIGDGSKRVIVFSQTTVDKSPHMDLAETIRNVSGRIPGGIAPEILNDFLTKNKQPRQLERRLNVGVAYLLLGREDLDRIFQEGDGWSEFHASYGGRGIVSVSRVGFNREMNQALVYTSIQSGPKTGVGYYVLLAAENSTWVIKHKAEVWVS